MDDCRKCPQVPVQIDLTGQIKGGLRLEKKYF